MSGVLSIETALGSLSRLASTSSVTLGPLTLTGVEVPSVLRVGGSQGLAMQQLVGGDRIIQPMGDNPDPIELSGMFIGPGAQSRGEALNRLRAMGAPLRLSIAGLSFMVTIANSGYSYAQQGAVIPFTVQLVIQPTVAPASSTSPSALANLVGPDIASAAATVSGTISTVSAYAANTISTVQSVTPQLSPIANMIGAGGLLAGVSDKLTVAGGLAGAGINFAAAPAAAASVIGGLQSAGTGLMAMIGQAGANLTTLSANAGSGRLVADMGSLALATQNAGVVAGAVQAGGLLNRASANATLAAGLTPSAAVVHA
ncbi:MAG: hypothetical protein ACRYHQ_31585 [Janthinobacterium lividum]